MPLWEVPLGSASDLSADIEARENGEGILIEERSCQDGGGGVDETVERAGLRYFLRTAEAPRRMKSGAINLSTVVRYRHGLISNVILTAACNKDTNSAEKLS